MNINDFINALSNELIKNNFYYIEISKDFNRNDIFSNNSNFNLCNIKGYVKR